MSGPLVWKLLGLIGAGIILYDAYKKDNLSRGILYGILCLLFPITFFLYWSFQSTPKQPPKQPKITKSKLCPKCGHTNSSRSKKCAQCNNALTL